jgi:hypothetical protein
MSLEKIPIGKLVEPKCATISKAFDTVTYFSESYINL